MIRSQISVATWSVTWYLHIKQLVCFTRTTVVISQVFVVSGSYLWALHIKQSFLRMHYGEQFTSVNAQRISSVVFAYQALNLIQIQQRDQFTSVCCQWIISLVFAHWAIGLFHKVVSAPMSVISSAVFVASGSVSWSLHNTLLICYCYNLGEKFTRVCGQLISSVVFTMNSEFVTSKI